MIKEYDAVKSTKKLSEEVLLGCKGVVVLIHEANPPAYVVEFFDDLKNTIAVLTVRDGEVEPR